MAKPKFSAWILDGQKLLAHSQRLGGLLSFTIGLLSLCCAWSVLADQKIIYVSASTGNDQNTGASLASGSNGPIASLTRALEILRQPKAQAPEGTQFVVDLQPGIYRLNSPLELDAALSGTASAPTVIRGEDAARVRITGTVALTSPMTALPEAISRRLPAGASAHVVAYDLKANRIPSWVGLQVHGFNAPARDNPNELFVHGVPQALAAWPKQGYASITALPDGKDGRRFKIGSDRPKSWADLNGVWATGYWGNDWADSFIPVGALSPDGTITMKRPPTYYGMAVGQRVRFENILEELDSSGYWYFDDRQGIAYVWLDHPKADNEVEWSVAPFLLRLSGVSHLRVTNLTIDGARGDLVDAENVEDVFVDHCRLSGSGLAAVRIRGTASGVTNSTISHAGSGGIYLSGGDRKNLQSGRLVASHDVIFDFGRIYSSNEPGIMIEGVGSRADHNLIYDGPHQAIYFRGNDHSITYNDIHDVDQDTGDAGAIYGGRDWTARGTEIAFNYLHAIHGVGPAGATGIYVDDQGSGTSIHGNLFFDVNRGVLIGGGLDNVVEGNMFVYTRTPVFFDNRGMTWEKEASGDAKSFLHTELAAVPYRSAIWQKRYPTLAHIESEGFGVPRRNAIWGNLVVRSGPMDLRAPPEILALQKIGANLTDDEPGFTVAAQGSAPPATAFALPADSKALKAGFKPIPVNEIGP